MSDALALLQALGGPAAIIARRNLTPDDDFEAIRRAVALDARVLGVDADPMAVGALAMQLRLRELAPPANRAPMRLAALVERFLACPVEWWASLEARLVELEDERGPLAATTALARALDPYGDYPLRRVRVAQ